MLELPVLAAGLGNIFLPNVQKRFMTLPTKESTAGVDRCPAYGGTGKQSMFFNLLIE